MFKRSAFIGLQRYNNDWTIMLLNSFGNKKKSIVLLTVLVI